MRVLGIDFTSRPTRRKPIICVECLLVGHSLTAVRTESWTSFADFENALRAPGPWIAGLDFPFGQSRRFIETVGWPAAWPEYVAYARSLGRAGFRAALDAYRQERAVGDKEHRRHTDILAGAISPQKLYGVPVGLMFFEGSSRLLEAGVTVPHLHLGDPVRLAVEAYPGIVARRLLGRISYKADNKHRQTEDRLQARRHLLVKLQEVAPERYGFRLNASDEFCIDPTGDHLDALICAVQAAWAWKNRKGAFGAPADIDSLEGWIAEPTLAIRPTEGSPQKPRCE